MKINEPVPIWWQSLLIWKVVCFFLKYARDSFQWKFFHILDKNAIDIKKSNTLNVLLFLFSLNILTILFFQPGILVVTKNRSHHFKFAVTTCNGTIVTAKCRSLKQSLYNLSIQEHYGITILHDISTFFMQLFSFKSCFVLYLWSRIFLKKIFLYFCLCPFGKGF